MSVERYQAFKVAGAIYEAFTADGFDMKNAERMIGYSIASAAHDKDIMLSMSKIKDYYDDARSYLRTQEED